MVADFGILKRVKNWKKELRVCFVMVAMSRIEEFGRQIGEEFGVEQVILFGSYAEGKATEDSDVDLLIIGPFDGRSADQSVKIRMKLRPKFPLDIIVRRPEDISRRLEMGDLFIKEIIEEGKVLYEAHN